MTDERIKQAALNNARWCDAVCRAHGRPGAFVGGMWVNRQETPPYYPNAVSITPGETGSGAQIAAIAALLDAGIPGVWAVKDSFCALDLAPLGFRLLFEAEWIYRPATLPPPSPSDVSAGVRWGRIEQASDLARWETAWRGGPADPAHDEPARIFLPALLADDTIVVIAAHQGREIIAGAIAYRTGDVVGLSNVFTPARNAQDFWGGCVAEGIRAFPGLPLVGYESGPELAEARACGFDAPGPLRVWVRAA